MKNDYETALDMMTEIIGQMRRMPEPKNDGLGTESALKEQVRKLVEDKRKLVEQLDKLAEDNSRLEEENSLLEYNMDLLERETRVRLEMKPTLKPCPFCGSKPEMLAIKRDEWVVTCTCDTCAVNPETDSFRSEEEAVSAWNHRAGGLTCDWR